MPQNTRAPAYVGGRDREGVIHLAFGAGLVLRVSRGVGRLTRAFRKGGETDKSLLYREFLLS